MTSPRIQLIGEMKVKGETWDLNSMGNLFGRLNKEVTHTNGLMRHIGYEGVTGNQTSVRFFGTEVNHMECIPEEMVGWDLNGDTWTIFNADNTVLWQEKLTWQWLEQTTSGDIIGEFTANCPPEWVNHNNCACQSFKITSHAYFATDRDCDDDVHIADYDPSWPKQYEEIAHWLQHILGADVALHIEHYGSTSIPGMPAKPVIDILVEIPSFDEARKRAIPLLSGPKCEYWQYSDHMIFNIRKELMGKRTHHIHMAPAGHRIWDGLAFRDYLKTHPEDAARYAELKHELSKRYQTDRERYTEAKSEFVKEIAAKLSLQM